MLSWSPPSFYSQDIIKYSLTNTIYNLLVNEISIINTSDVSVWLNISYCTVQFNVSIITYITQYQSIKEKSIENEKIAGSK